MSTLILDERQSQVVAMSDGSVEIRDANGRLLGTLTPTDAPDELGPIELRPDVVEELIRRMSQDNIQWATTEEVLQRLGGRNAS